MHIVKLLSSVIDVANKFTCLILEKSKIVLVNAETLKDSWDFRSTYAAFKMT